MKFSVTSYVFAVVIQIMPVEGEDQLLLVQLFSNCGSTYSMSRKQSPRYDNLTFDVHSHINIDAPYDRLTTTIHISSELGIGMLLQKGFREC